MGPIGQPSQRGNVTTGMQLFPGGAPSYFLSPRRARAQIFEKIYFGAGYGSIGGI